MRWGAGEKDEVKFDRDLKKNETRAALHARTRAFNYRTSWFMMETLVLARRADAAYSAFLLPLRLASRCSFNAIPLQPRCVKILST